MIRFLVLHLYLIWQKFPFRLTKSELQGGA